MSRTLTALVVLALLVAAFVFPSRFFKAFGNETISFASAAAKYAEQDDLETAAAEMEKASAAFDKGQRVLKYLLDHEEVDKLAVAIKRAKRAAELGDKDETLFSIDELIVLLEYIPLIEAPTLENIF